MSYMPQQYQAMPPYIPQPVHQPMSQADQMQAQRYAAQGVPWVNSIDEVRSCITPFGQKTMFMNRYEPVFYIRDVDRNGTAFVYEYSFSEKTDEQTAAQPEYITRDEMMAEINKIKEQYESLVQPAVAAYEPVAADADEPFAPRHAATSDTGSTAVQPTLPGF